jgi:hypothetical protein
MMPGPKSDKDVCRLWDAFVYGAMLDEAAKRAGMSLPTARKYWRNGNMPSESKTHRDWRTRNNPFEEVWAEIEALIRDEPRLKAKTIFEDLQAKYPGRFQDGQLRTLQRHLRQWRASDGPNREAYFPQIHHPGDIGASDFTDMSGLNITIAGQSFSHLLYHFVLTYSNWETASICFSESFESLAEGFQKAVWELGGVPRRHRTDSLSAAVKNLSPQRDFTDRLCGLMLHYKVQPTKTNPRSPNENGDCESLHGHLKTAIDQALLLRGSRDFADRKDYQTFLDGMFEKKNAGRSQRFEEEHKALGALPAKPLPFFDTVETKVRSSSTISVKHNIYSVPSRLIGEEITIRVFAEHLEIWYAQRRSERLPRLHGKNKHHINYRHVIDSLVRKPGAFENYRWRDDLFPSVRFRMAYDELLTTKPARASREYLQILYLAARESESGVEAAIQRLLEEGRAIDAASVKEIVKKADAPDDMIRAPEIPQPDFEEYNMLFETDMSLDSDAVENVEVMEIDLADRLEANHHELEQIVTVGAELPREIVVESLFDMESRNYGEIQGDTIERGTDGTASRVASADSPRGVRGDGADGREPIAQLRAISGRTDSSGMRRAPRESDREAVAAVEDPAGEDIRGIQDAAAAPQSEPPGKDASCRRFLRPR